MFNVSVNDKKNIYRSKPVMNVDTVPKPLTYDYMPEGYPSKSVENVTLMEEQEVAFSEQNGLIAANSPVDLDIKLGDKLTVVWDGVNYDVVVKERGTSGPGGNLVEKMFGNLALINRGESEDYPFVYYRVSASIEEFYWIAEDAATSHTIKVMRPTVKYAPIDVNYMPEGYPKKNVKIDTSEEQEVAFIGDSDGIMKAQVFIGFEITYGDNLTVVWDGVSYDVVVKNATAGPNTSPGFGNLGLIGAGDTTEHPFACVYLGGICMWGTADTATSHTIKVMRQQETITPMSTDFIPKNLNVVFTGIKQIEDQQVPTSCNVTYDELRRFADNDMPIFAIYKYDSYDGVPMCKIITDYRLKSAPVEGNTDMVFYYQVSGNGKAFVYKSDGTISELPLT